MTDNANRETILIVDDDRNLLKTVGDLLEHEGYSTSLARSGEEALRVLDAQSVQLILLDISMPGMGGLHFLNEIALPEGGTNVPVVVLTARATMEGFFEDVDVAAFLAKPCPPEKLLATIKDAIGRAPQKKERDASAPRRILLGENEPDILAHARDAFVRSGYAVETVGTGAEALEKAVQFEPDAIVLREILPGMNGSVVASLLGTMPSTRDIPVVLYDETRSLEEVRRHPHRNTVNVFDFLATSEPGHLLQAVKAAVKG